MATTTHKKATPSISSDVFLPSEEKSKYVEYNILPPIDYVKGLLCSMEPLDDGMVELINISFLADKDYILREPNKEYIEREIEWYKSQSLYVDDIPGQTPKIWEQVSDSDGRINSNYGWCIFSAENNYQYSSAVQQLQMDKNTRKAIMIYTRPSMQTDYNHKGMSDFICTNNVQLFIRNNKLIYIVNQRSCDAVFGFNNDLAWHNHVYDMLMNNLSEKYPELKKSYIQYNCGSLHVYPRHQHLLKG